ncbi:DUF3383 family protein [Fluviispira vulneris]|uniref:DUF3383 family protein n=1 Tax=Fluviispira vulneris TaxID=2763012 RepID=UPI0016445538|nr:DUF3383 family protein [Fluviispira vulneris]
MTSVDNVVEVNITKQSSFVKEKSFNIPLILGFNSLPVFTTDNPVLTFSEPSELLDTKIGFKSTDKEYLIAQNIYAQSPSISQFMVGKRCVSSINSDPTKSVYKINDDLELINKANNSWYALFLADFDEEKDLLLAAKWIEASKNKIASFRTTNRDILDATKLTDISNKLSNIGFNRSMLTYHTTANEFPDAAILGKYLSKKAGTYCLAHKGLESISAQSLIEKEFKSLQAANCNVYTDILGVNSYQDGRVLHKTTNFIDNTIAEDYLKSELQSRIFGALKSEDGKISFDDDGLEIIATQIKSVLSQFEKDKIILKNWDVNVPKLNEISKIDRPKRELKNVKFNAVLNGAIQKVVINGTLSQ